MKRLVSLVLAVVMLFGCTQIFAGATGSTAGGNTTDFRIVRLGGDDRIETANLICAEGWADKAEKPDDSGFSTEVSMTDGQDTPSDSDVPSGTDTPSTDEHTPIFAVIANGYDFADALAGVPLAYTVDAPILLTDGETLKPSVIKQLERIGAEYIYILGGEKAVSADVEAQLVKLGCTVSRLAGDSRFGTAVTVADEIKRIKGTAPENVFVAYAYNYPDALSAGSAAALLGAPILYSDSSGVPDADTSVFIYASQPDVVLLGGSTVLSDNAERNFSKYTKGSVSRIFGSDRYETALKIYSAYSEIFTSSDFALASGDDFPDSLAGGALCAKRGIPVLSTCTYKTTEGIYDLAKKNSPDKIYVFGGTAALSDYVVNTLLSGGTVTAPTTTTRPAPDPTKHITRKLTVKVNSAKVYADLLTSSKVVATVSNNKTFTSLGEDEGDDGKSWFKVSVNGKIGWICRTEVNISNTYVPIEDRVFSKEHQPIIYLSPSKQGSNSYATGKTTEQKEMEAVAKIIKQILDKEYNCTTYIATPTVDIIARTDEALDYGADIYLAIHSNATGDSSTCYGATAYHFPACAQSKLLAQNIVLELNKIAPVKPNVNPQVINGMNSFWNIGYGEVRSPSNSGMVSVLAETEFHDNKIGSEWIRTHHDEIARAYVKALANTFGITKK